MSSTKHHLKTDHNGDVEHIRAARKDLRELQEKRGDELSVKDLVKFIDVHLSGLEGHKKMMSQEADGLYDEITNQSHLVGPLTQGQPYFRRATDIKPDNVRGVLVPNRNTAVDPEFMKVFGSLEDGNAASPAGLIPVPRAGQPPIGRPPNVPVEFEHLVKVEDE